MKKTYTHNDSRKTDVKIFRKQGTITQYSSGLTKMIQARDADEARNLADQLIRNNEFSGTRVGDTWLTDDIVGCKKVVLSKLTFGNIGKENYIDSRNLSEKINSSIKTDAEYRVLDMQYSVTRKSTTGGQMLSLEDVSAPVCCTGSYEDGHSSADLIVNKVEAGQLYEVTLPYAAGDFANTEGAETAKYTAIGFNKISVEDSDLSAAAGGSFTFTEKKNFKCSGKKTTGTLNEESTTTIKASGTFLAKESLSNVVGKVTGFKTVDMEFTGGLTRLQGGNYTEKIKRKSIVSALNWKQESEEAPWLPSEIDSVQETKTVTEESTGKLTLLDCQVSGEISGFSNVNIEFSPERYYHILDTSYHLLDSSNTYTAYSIRDWPILTYKKTVENIFGGKTVTVTRKETLYDESGTISAETQTSQKTETATGSLSVENAKKIGAGNTAEAIRGFKTVSISSCGEVGFITGGNRVTATDANGYTIQTLKAAGKLLLANTENAAGADGFQNVTLNAVKKIGSISVGMAQAGCDQVNVKGLGSSLTVNYGYWSSGTVIYSGYHLNYSSSWWRPYRPIVIPTQPVNVTEITGPVSGFRNININANTKMNSFSGTAQNDKMTVNGNDIHYGIAVFGEMDFGDGKDTLELKKNGVFATDLNFTADEKTGRNNWNLEKITGTGTIILKKGNREKLMNHFKFNNKTKIQVLESSNFSQVNSNKDVWESAKEISGETEIQCDSNWLGFCNNIDYYAFCTKEIGSQLGLQVNLSEKDQTAVKWSLQKYDSDGSSWQIVTDETAPLLADSSYRIALERRNGNLVSLDYSSFTIAFKTIS